MNYYKVNRDLIPYMEKLHEEKGMSFSITDKGEQTFLHTPLSGNAYHRMVKVARCIRTEQEEKLPFPILTAETASNAKKKKKVLKKYGTRTYVLPHLEASRYDYDEG